jgi:DNA gyrase inhibitor GyrI
MELFNQIDELKQELKTFLPYVEVCQHTLTDHSSLFIKVSLDEPETWYFRIYENSKFAKISISDSKMEILSRSRETAKMRKCNVKTVGDVVNKLKKWKEESSVL